MSLAAGCTAELPVIVMVGMVLLDSTQYYSAQDSEVILSSTF